MLNSLLILNSNSNFDGVVLINWMNVCGLILDRLLLLLLCYIIVVVVECCCCWLLLFYTTVVVTPLGCGGVVALGGSIVRLS